ncbi:MAG: sigma-54-dependent Fis family transcriptional regulator [Deltaproteobacteria bacterium]|nr:sigma-54-dependent Fis family transcriptional regulator [Deltaproteobacteria bacterium]
MLTILSVEDDLGYAKELKKRVWNRFENARVVEAHSVEEAERELEVAAPDLVVSDIVLGKDEDGGVKVVTHVRARAPGARIVTLSGRAREFAQGMLAERRIDDYILKGTEWEEIRARLEYHVEACRRERAAADLRRDAAGVLVAEDASMKEVVKRMSDVAKRDTAVLILGEHGSGKELVARQIHFASTRATRSFVPVNCAGVRGDHLASEIFGHTRGAVTNAPPERDGRLIQADGGTLFLDEVTEATPEVQSRLLRLLLDGTFEPIGSTVAHHVNVRIVSASTRDIEREVAEGRFREDLFYRVGVFPIRLKPLCERAADLPALVRHFVGQFNRSMGRCLTGVSAEAEALLEAHAWPGNVRELKTVLERAFLVETGSELGLGSLKAAGLGKKGAASEAGFTSKNRDWNEARDEYERHFLVLALERNRGDTSKAAKEVGLPLRTLQDRLKRLKVVARAFK